MTNQPIYLSKKGMRELKKRIEQLELERQGIIADLHSIDKGEGHDERLARVEKLATFEMIESELADKKQILNSAKPLPRRGKKAFKVALGSVVDLLDASGKVVRYTIVDSLEANPSDGRISVNSPLGKILLGKKLKDVVEWTAGRLGTHRSRLINIA